MSAFKSNRQEECGQMPGKMARSAHSTIIRASRGAGSHPHCRISLAGRPENANICAILGSHGESRFTASARSSVSHGRKIAVIGLGYVGLPVAAAFARSGVPVIAFDIDPARVRELQAGRDRTREVKREDLARSTLTFTTDAAALKNADFFIVTVPTPIDEARRPDLGALLKASETVGNAIRPGGIVVYELTVYPGATEEDCAPVLAVLIHEVFVERLASVA